MFDNLIERVLAIVVAISLLAGGTPTPPPSPAPTVAVATSITITVTLTSYSCENVATNPMYPCGPLRFAPERAATTRGLACPPEWAGRHFVLDEYPEYGELECDDSPYRKDLNGYPHVDVRVDTVAEALQIGIRTTTITEVTE